MNRDAPLFSSPIGLDIARHADDPATVFVFPSQDSADSWAEVLVRSGLSGAVALDRFFGFENFIRFCAQASLHKGGREARSLDRWLWALEALSEFSGAKESSRRLISGEEDSVAQLSRLVNLVPSLYENTNIACVAEAAKESPFAFIKEEAGELAAFADHYRGFLRKNAIVDGHFPPFGIPRGANVRAYGLEEEFARLGFRGVEFPEIMGAQTQGPSWEYFEFDSFLSEMEWALSSVEGEIERGSAPEDIVISVCRMNAQKAAWIREIASDAGVAISIRWGEPLSGTPFGRLLGALQASAAEGLTLESLDAFAAFPSIRMRNNEGWKALREGALKAHIPTTSPYAPYIHQLWKEAFRSGLLPESTGQMYSKLWKEISDIAGAESFVALYEGLLGFMEGWVDTTRFGSDARTDKSMRMALNELQSWRSAEPSMVRGGFAPFELFMAELGSKAYIPLLEPGTVRVYDILASSGMAALSHYIVGASQSGFAPSFGAATAMPASLSTLLEEANQDRSLRILALHCVSRAVFSYAREGFEGYEVALPQLGEPSRAAPHKKARHGAGEGESSPVSACPERPVSDGSGRLSPQVRARARETTDSIDTTTGLAVFSPHSLKDRAQCGFKWFAKRLGLEDSYAGEDSALIIGNFLHDAYERAVARVSGGGGMGGTTEGPPGATGSSGAAGATRTKDGFDNALDIALHASAAKIIAEKGPGLRPILSALTEKARHRLTVLWEFEGAVFAEYTQREFERKIALLFEEEGVILNGRIDCVFSRIDESPIGARCCSIIDYKKNSIPSLSDMKPKAVGEQSAERAGDDEDGSVESEETALGLGEIQIPAYALMLEMQGDTVEGALYWSIEKAKAAGYIQPPASGVLAAPIRSAYREPSETAPVRAALRDMLAAAAEKLARGELLDRAVDRASCGDCTFAPLCRYWYFLELR